MKFCLCGDVLLISALLEVFIENFQFNTTTMKNTSHCAGSVVGTAFRGAPFDADVEAARLALELAHERAQREKAERDFEVRQDTHVVPIGPRCFSISSQR